ncbi:MAG TPA: phosphoesterase, partial [Gammaproteobacteria bacterium]|nr:phosphoesterase [Gammaproteobacteria bacterium]
MAQGTALAAFALTSTTLYAGTQDQDRRGHDTLTPIKHVILIIGENRTFDNVFATFRPDRHQRVWNLLSEGIVNTDGTPGPNFARAQQWQASDTGAYSLHPGKTAPYVNLEPVTVSGAPSAPYFPSTAVAQAIEPALPASYYPFLV